VIWRLLGVLCALVGCASPAIRPAPFRARPDTIKLGDLRGPFEGRVTDVENDRPVAGALVYASWSFVSGYGLNAPSGWHEYLGTTDAGGRYSVPRLDKLPSGGSIRLADFRLVIYKRGFVAYRSDRRWDDFGPRTDFAQEGHVVELQRWRSDFSHVKHLRYVGGGPTLTELTSWETAEAARELSGEKPTVVATTPEPLEPSQPQVPNLAAEKFLVPNDVKKTTGYQGEFDVLDLADEPTTAQYDSVHLQARGKDESFDIALRLWVLPTDEAKKHYDRMSQELPGAVTRDEIGDKSLRASTAKGEILGMAYLDAKRGIVALVQCGAAQCRSHETLLTVVRIVKDRLDAEIVPQVTP
jgi:hypothetical protein